MNNARRWLFRSLAGASLLLCLTAALFGVRSYRTGEFWIVTFHHVDGPVLVLSDGDSALARDGMETARSRFIILDSGGIRVGYRDTQEKEISAFAPHIHLNEASYRTQYVNASRPATGYPLVWGYSKSPHDFAAGRATDDTGGLLIPGEPVATSVSSYALVFPIWVFVIAAGAYPAAYFGKRFGRRLFFLGVSASRRSFLRFRTKNRFFGPDSRLHWPGPWARVK
jgi:hypothetical protein